MSFPMYLLSDPFLYHSVTRYNLSFFGSSIISFNQSTLGCSNVYRTFSSSITQSMANLFLPAFCFLSRALSISLRAYFVLVVLSLQRYTLAKLPLPRTFSISYWFTFFLPNLSLVVERTEEVLLLRALWDTASSLIELSSLIDAALCKLLLMPLLKLKSRYRAPNWKVCFLAKTLGVVDSITTLSRCIYDFGAGLAGSIVRNPEWLLISLLLLRLGIFLYTFGVLGISFLRVINLICPNAGVLLSAILADRLFE